VTDRSTCESLLAEGYDLLGAGEPARALRCFEAAASHPDPEVDAARAEACIALSRWEDAIGFWTAAVEKAPETLRYRLGLGEAQRAAGGIDASVRTLEAAVALRPDSAQAQLSLARSLKARGDLTSAIDRYQEVIHLDGDARDALVELGVILVEQSREREGIALLERCARSHPGDAPVHLELAKAWHRLWEPERARAFLARCLELEADQAEARALRERIEREEAEVRSGSAPLPGGYVRALFDQYADRFDEALLSGLDYRAPRIIRELLEPLLLRQEVAPRSLDALDLGCGTGLSGEPIRPWSRRLVGVDLSPRMIEKARARGIYDDLRVGDLLSALSEETGGWDLIVACDTLVYLGDLRPVFRLAFHALRPGGWFVATVETPERDPCAGSPSEGVATGASTESVDPEHASSEIEFKKTRRFGHAEPYLRALADEFGFRVRSLARGGLRKEQGRLLEGIGFVLERPGVELAARESLPQIHGR